MTKYSKPSCNRIAAPALSTLLVVLLAAQGTIGFSYPLSPQAIREAYFLGKENPEERQAFLKPYKHNLPMPESGPHVGLIEVETPFVFVAEAVAAAGENYHAQDVDREFAGKPLPFRVHFEIYFTATYPDVFDTAASLGKFWEDFTVYLKQSTEIAPRTVKGQPIYSDATVSGYKGAVIDVDYDVKKIDADAPVTIGVNTPDEQNVETTFDLSQLR